MPPRKTAASDSPKMLSTRTLITINRDQTATTPQVVWAHQLPILEAVHGEGNVRLIDPTDLDEGFSTRPSPELMIWNKTQDPVRRPSETLGLGFVFCGDPRSEYDRLCNLYGRHPEINQPFAEFVFGRYETRQFARLVGEPEMDDLPDEQIRSLVAQYGFVPMLEANPSDEQKKLVRDKTLELANAPRDDLLKYADQLGVQLA